MKSIYTAHTEREREEFYEVCNDASDDNESIQSTSDVNDIEKHELVGDFDTFDLRDHMLKYRKSSNKGGKHSTILNHPYDYRMQ